MKPNAKSHQSHQLLFSVADIRAIEASHAKAHPKISLMQKAGEAVASHAIKIISKQKAKKILVLAGPGNNGGDAWVAARALQKKKMDVTVLAIGEQKYQDAAAKKAYTEYIKAKGVIQRTRADGAGGTSGKAAPVLVFGLIIDGVFGIGLSKKPAGEFLDAIRYANEIADKNNTPILAIDIASGLVADTGEILGGTGKIGEAGEAGEAIRATTTLTFLGAKPGLYTADGVDCSGDIIVDSLGVDLSKSLPTSLPTLSGMLLTENDCAALIPQRRNNSHKGTYGNVGIIGGSDGMVGAAVIAARAALHMGPGKVYVGLMAKNVMAFDSINPEIMVRTAADLAEDPAITAFAIGMGMGAEVHKNAEAKSTKSIMAKAIASGKPILIDADALHFVMLSPAHSQKTANPNTGGAFEAQMPQTARPARTLQTKTEFKTVLTPHPGEAAKLLNITTAEVQRDRISAALLIAKLADAVVVLKGAGTIIATPPMADNKAQYFINTTGNPGMASGGMGDALSGMIAAFMAQGLSTLDAAKLGVYLHGAAADAACHHGMGPNGLTASEVIFEARSLLNSGLADHHD